MHVTHIHYFPVAWPFVVFLAGLFIGLMLIIQFGVLRYAYSRIGIDRRYVFGVLLLSLLGSYINIPVVQLPAQQVMAGQEIYFFGMRYVIPVVRDWPGTVIAVNVGGAVIPTLLSIYLLVKNRLYGLGFAGVAIMTVVCHLLAYPVPGLGIGEPVFVPPVATTIVALMLSRRYAAPLAYISGSLGTLIGADLLNLDAVGGLGAPVASIGGAGTFDGIFVTGILAVLLASIATARDLAAESALPSGHQVDQNLSKK
jgi:uncharacterized membrane protein